MTRAVTSPPPKTLRASTKTGETDTEATRALLGLTDPAPVEWVNRDSPSPVLLLCEHAGQAIPEALADLGLPDGAIDLHIGWDIGAERLARALASLLGAPLILQRYSRLVIDCNRPPETEDAIPAISDGITVPGNQGLSEHARQARRRAVFDPLEAAITQGLDAHSRRAAFSIHSFTRQMRAVSPQSQRDGNNPGTDRERPWHAGFLARRDIRTTSTLLAHIVGRAPELNLTLNEPYQVDDATDWFIPAHAEPRGLAHALVEVRNDQLTDGNGIDRWADLLAGAITSLPEMNS